MNDIEPVDNEMRGCRHGSGLNGEESLRQAEMGEIAREKVDSFILRAVNAIRKQNPDS